MHVHVGDVLQGDEDGYVSSIHITYIGNGGDMIIARELKCIAPDGTLKRGVDREMNWTLSQRDWQRVRRGGGRR
jgi:hypothetical protein